MVNAMLTNGTNYQVTRKRLLSFYKIEADIEKMKNPKRSRKG
jgi:hypothetical protein